MNKEERQYLASVLEQNAQLRKRLDARVTQLLVLLDQLEARNSVIEELGYELVDTGEPSTDRSG
jgi:hypothetical protein